MSAAVEAIRLRLQRKVDERETTSKLHNDLLAAVESRTEERDPSEAEQQTITNYRVSMERMDTEIEELNELLEREEKSAQTNRRVRAHLAGQNSGGELTPDGDFKYRTFGAYARDKMIAQFQQIAELAGGAIVREAAQQRLTRAPVNTLSTDVAGLQPEQHFAQILEVIDRSRPVVQSARRLALERGAFTFPHVDQKPEVLLQAAEKTEAGTANMQVSMVTVTAQTFLGGGDLSWQAVNWSTPDALNLWFDMAGEQYARQTEGTACAILTACGTANQLGTADRIGTASTFAEWLSGVITGVQTVYDNSGAMANTLYLSPDMYFLAAALTTDAGAALISQGNLTINTLGGNVAGIRVVTSYGFANTTAIIGDASAFLVAETAGAPVQLRVTEPSIAGFEVGVVGAFAAQCYDDNRFAKIS